MGLDLTFLHAGRMPRCRARVDKHFAGYQTLQFIRQGAVELFYGEERHVVRAPAFWTCYPGPHIRFHGHRNKSWHHLYVAMRGPGLVDLQQRGLFFRGVQPCPPRHARHSAGQMARIIDLIRAPGSLSAPRAANLLESVLLDLAEWRHARNQTEPWLATVLAALEAETRGRPDYAALARQCGMALSTLRRRFRQKAGATLHHYALELRISRACRLVGTTDLSFKEIAEELGYDNVFYFSRQFRKFQGVPPLTYRRSRQS